MALRWTISAAILQRPGERPQGCRVALRALWKGGDNPEPKDWASRTLPTLQHHLEMAQGLH
ncbi:MAG: DUF4142 domain-containing protein [Acidobacteriaceae bacterium]|nr:DUF4142 domain-containing protein [Acidobacteriaceae bacterium]